MVDWQNRRDLANELEILRRAIVRQIAERDPAEALDPTWRLLALASSVFERCDDSSGTVIGICHAACGDLEITKAAKADPNSLPDQALQA